jgi:hypothetical protein
MAGSTWMVILWATHIFKARGKAIKSKEGFCGVISLHRRNEKRRGKHGMVSEAERSKC